MGVKDVQDVLKHDAKAALFEGAHAAASHAYSKTKVQKAFSDPSIITEVLRGELQGNPEIQAVFAATGGDSAKTVTELESLGLLDQLYDLVQG